MIIKKLTGHIKIYASAFVQSVVRLTFDLAALLGIYFEIFEGLLTREVTVSL